MCDSAVKTNQSKQLPGGARSPLLMHVLATRSSQPSLVILVVPAGSHVFLSFALFCETCNFPGPRSHVGELAASSKHFLFFWDA